MIAINEDKDARLFQTTDRELRKRVDQFPLTMFAAAFSADGRLSAMGGVDRRIHISETKTWNIVQILEGQPETVHASSQKTDAGS